MIDPLTAVNFFGASVLLGISPGPDVLFVMTQGMAGGRRAGVIVTLGLCCGLFYHTFLVAFGLAVILQAWPFFLTGLKYAGAAYLLYLAYQAFRSSGNAKMESLDKPLSAKALFFRGVVMNVTNPKVTIFFLSFLPQFADPAQGPVWVQILALGVIFMLATLFTFGSVAVLADSLGQKLFKSQASRIWLDRMAGVVFLLLAFYFLTLGLSKSPDGDAGKNPAITPTAKTLSTIPPEK